jgi:long-chain acyl-CoA synthetase
MPSNELLLPEILELHGRWRGNWPALITEDEQLNWRTLNFRTNRIANGLLAAGCADGRVAVLMDNGTAMAELLIGAIKAGVTIVPLNPAVADGAIRVMLADAEPKAIFVSKGHRDRIGNISDYSLRVSAGPGNADWEEFTVWRDKQTLDPPATTIQPETACNIIYSSGTTGQPKGIVHSFACRTRTAHLLAHALRYHSGAKTLIVTGLFSNISWASMLPTLLLGGTLVVRPSFDPEDVLRCIERERITHVSMVPVQYQRLLDTSRFSAADRSSMQSMMCCGAPLPTGIKQRLFDSFPCGLIELYGSTEGVLTTLPPEEAIGRITSVGKPLPGEDLVILGDGDQPLPWGEAGEIVALTPIAMGGYWNNATATQEAFWIDPEGRRWLRSGDIGKFDEEGYLYITDRKKDMIISGGQNVYPADLEAVLLRHPSVQDCAVFGVPHEKWGETPLALVVLGEGEKQSAEALLGWVNAQLGKQQRVHAIELRPSLPRNANGKLLKRELRTPYWATAKSLSLTGGGKG